MFSHEDLFDMMGGRGGGGGGIHSIFESLGGGGRASRRRKGKTFMVPHEVTLEQLYTGDNVEVKFDRDVICHKCKGQGGKPGAVQKCRECRGQGMVMKVVQQGPGMIMQTQGVCSNCHGQGEQINEKDKCKTCQGRKVLKKPAELQVEIEAGMKHGQKLPFTGEADQHPDMDSGDVIVVLQQKPHPTIKREGHDLLVEQKITLTEALTGFNFIFTHLDGRQLMVRSPPGRVLSHDCIRGLSGEGLSRGRKPGRGNLYFKFSVVFPDDKFANDESLKMIEEFLPKRSTPYPIKLPQSAEYVNMMDSEACSSAYDPDEEHYDEDSDRPHGHSCQTS